MRTLSVRPMVCLFVCLIVFPHLFIHLFVCLIDCRYTSVCPSVCLFVWWFGCVCLSICLFVCLFDCSSPSVCLFVQNHLFVCGFILCWYPKAEQIMTAIGGLFACLLEKSNCSDVYFLCIALTFIRFFKGVHQNS